jgi:hypothetical protein
MKWLNIGYNIIKIKNKKMNPYISFILPIRKRPISLKKNLDSLLSTCNDVNNYEVIVVFDDDDVSTIQEFDSWDKPFNYKKIVTERLGYDNLHKYYNMACEEAKGEWLWTWNDDVEMVNKDWDLVLKEYEGQFLILNPFNTREYDAEFLLTHTLFPIIPKRFFNLFSYISPWNHFDMYIERLCPSLIKNEFRLLHTHDKHDDEVSQEIVYHRIPFPEEQLQIDIIKLNEYLSTINV